MHTLRLSLVGTAILALLGGLSVSVAGQSVVPGDRLHADPQSVISVGNSFIYANGGVETHVAALVASEYEPRPFEVDAATVEG